MAPPTPLRSGKSSAPGHLASEEAALFTTVVRSYGIADEVSLKILEEACVSLQRARTARETIDRDGMTYLDGKGKPKPHPLLPFERDARAAALAAFRQLNFELPRPLGKRSAW